jgi:hypothetical protein
MLSYLDRVRLDEGILNKAFSEIEEIKNKVFSFSDECFAYKISKEECLKRLDNISCYDEFLSCYLWLISNDTDFVQRDMWARLCTHIDIMLNAPRLRWDEFFNDRFSIDELNESYNILEVFFRAFKEKILLPLQSFEEAQEKSLSAKECLFNILTSKRHGKKKVIISGDEELARLAKEANKMLQTGDSEESLAAPVSLINNQPEDEFYYEDVSLVDSAKIEENVFDMAVRLSEDQKKGSSIDALDTTKAYEVIGKSDISQNKQFAIDDIDTSKTVEALRGQKVSKAEDMNGLITDNGEVKQIYAEVNPLKMTRTVSREQFAYDHTSEFEKRQSKQVKKHFRANIFKTMLKVLIVAALFALFWWQTHR